MTIHGWKFEKKKVIVQKGQVKKKKMKEKIKKRMVFIKSKRKIKRKKGRKDWCITSLIDVKLVDLILFEKVVLH